MARNSFFIGPLIGRDGCRPEGFFFSVCISFFFLFFFRSTHREKEYLGVIPQYLTAPPYSLHCSRTLDSGCISYSEWLRYIKYIISISFSIYVYVHVLDMYTVCMYVCCMYNCLLDCLFQGHLHPPFL